MRSSAVAAALLIICIYGFFHLFILCYPINFDYCFILIGFVLDRKFISTYSKDYVMKSIMNPYYVTGFVDGEGCFSVSVVNKKGKTG